MRKTTAAPPPEHVTEVVVRGRTIVAGDEFSVRGEGRFSFRYVSDGGTSVTCWGPVGSQQAGMRTFRIARITTIHKTTTPTHKGKKQP